MRDGARGAGRIPRGAARRDEGERNGNSETGYSAQRTGVSAGGIDAYDLQGIGKRDLNLEGMPVFGDDAGPHGSATSDSERTMVTATTTQVLAIIVSFGGPESLERWTQRLGALLQQYAVGTNIVTNVVT